MKVKNNNVETNITNSKKFTIQASRKAFEILSSQIYTYKERAIIRELVCNAYDSHKMAKTDSPIIIKIEDNTLSIIDHGVGMTQSQMEKLYTTYFDSNKSNTNEFIGGLGLGSKSPFCYTNSFTVISKCKGKLSEYYCFIGEDGPQLLLQNSEDCNESGFEVHIPLKSEDISKFVNEARAFISECQDKANIELWLDGSKIEDIASTYHKFLTDSFYTTTSPGYGVFIVRMGLVSYTVKIDVLREFDVEQHIRYLITGHMIDLPIGSLEVAASRETLSLTKDTKVKLVNFVRSEIEDVYKKAKKELSIYTNDVIRARKTNEMFRKVVSIFSFDFERVGCKHEHYADYTLENILGCKLPNSVPKSTRELNLLAYNRIYRTRTPNFYTKYQISQLCYDMPEVKDAIFVYIPKTIFNKLDPEIRSLFTEADIILENCKERLKDVVIEKRTSYNIFNGITLTEVVNFLREGSAKSCNINAKELKPGTIVVHVESPYDVIRSFNNFNDCIRLNNPLLLQKYRYFTKLSKDYILKRNPTIKFVEFPDFMKALVEESEHNLEIIRIASLIDEKLTSRLKTTLRVVKELDPKLNRFWEVYEKLRNFINQHKTYSKLDYYGILREIKKYIPYEAKVRHINLIDFLNSTPLTMLKVFNLDMFWDSACRDYSPNPEQAEIARYFVKAVMSENGLQGPFYGYNSIKEVK